MSRKNLFNTKTFPEFTVGGTLEVSGVATFSNTITVKSADADLGGTIAAFTGQGDTPRITFTDFTTSGSVPPTIALTGAGGRITADGNLTLDPTSAVLCEGPLIIDETSATALVVRKDSGGTSILTVDTSGDTISTPGHLQMSVDSSTLGGSGSITFGAGDDAGVYFDGTDLQTVVLNSASHTLYMHEAWTPGSAGLGKGVNLNFNAPLQNGGFNVQEFARIEALKSTADDNWYTELVFKTQIGSQTVTDLSARMKINDSGQLELYSGYINTSVTTSSGAAAIPITDNRHDITTTGTGNAMTLANGSSGQYLTVVYVAEGAGADTAILTPTTLLGKTTITFNAIGDSVVLQYGTGGWSILSNQGCTLA